MEKKKDVEKEPRCVAAEKENGRDEEEGRDMVKKYELLTDEEHQIQGYQLGDRDGNTVDLYRIRALRDFDGIKKGDIGGYVQSEENLSHKGTCWIYDDAIVCEHAKVQDSAKVSEHAEVRGHSTVCNDASIFGHASVNNYACVAGNARIFGDAVICDSAVVSGNAAVYGYAEVNGTSAIYTCSKICGHAVIHNSYFRSGSIDVTGNVAINSIRNLVGDFVIATKTDLLYVGPIGSKGRITVFIRCANGDSTCGIWVVCGCFYGTIEEFEERVKKVHKGTIYEKEYLAAIQLAKTKMLN